MNAEKRRQRMHILQLLPSLDVGGMEMVVSRFSDELIARGMLVSIGELVRPGNLPGRSAYVKQWAGRLQEERGAFDLACHWRLWLFLLRNRFSLVHVHNPKACLYALTACILSGTPLVYTVHGSGSPLSVHNRTTRLIHQMGSHFIRQYIAVSDDALNRLIHRDRVPAETCCVIRNGILAESFACGDDEPSALKQLSRARLGIPYGCFVVGSVGRLSKEKNYPLLVEAFASLLQTLSGAAAQGEIGGSECLPKLVLVGDGPDKSRIQAAIAHFGVGKHCLLPGVQADIRNWLGAMDVFCLSSDTEGTSISLLEAGAAGLPAVVTDVGGNPEVVLDGQSGLVVPKGDAAALARSLVRLMQNRSECVAFGQRAFQRVKSEYSMESMADAYVSVYESVCHGGRWRTEDGGAGGVGRGG